MPSLNRPIKTVSSIILITIFIKMLGFFRVFFMAKVFGTGIEASAFEAAYRIPDMLFTGIGMALSTTFIPIYTEYMNKQGAKESNLFASYIINALFILTLGISVLGIVFAPQIVNLIYWGFEGSIYLMTVNLVRIMFPIIIFIALSFTCVGILQSHGEFNIPAAISMPSNIINLIYLILMSSYFGIYGFGAAVLIGWSTQLLIQIPWLKKKNYKYEPVLSLHHSGVKKMFIMAIPIILGTSVQQINSLVNSALASGLGDSAVAALGYGNYLYIIIVGVFTLALSSFIFPTLSKMHALENYTEFKNTVNSAVKIIFFVLAPITAAVLVLNVPIIRVLLQRGRFDFNSTLLTSTVLLYYSIGMIGFGIQEIANKAFYAIQNTSTPMKVAGIGITLNIFLNFILVKYMNIGGLALANSAASIAIAAGLVYKLSRLMPNIFDKSTLISGIKAVISSLIMGAVLFYLSRNLIDILNDSVYKVMISILLCSIFGVLVYCVSAFVFKSDEIKTIQRILKSKMDGFIKGKEVQ